MWWNDYEDDFSEEQRPALSVPDILRRVYPFIRPYRLTFLFSFVLGLLGVGFVLIQPVLLKQIIDKDVPSGSFKALSVTATIFLITMLASAVINFFSSWLLQKAGVGAVNDIKVKLFDHYLGLGLAFLEKYPVGKLVSRIESDTQRLVALTSTMILRVIMSIGMLIGAVIILAVVDLRLFAIVVAVLPLIIAGTYFLFKWLRPWFREERSKYADVSAVVAEFVKSVSLLQLYDRQGWAAARLNRKNRSYANFTSRIGFVEYGIFRGLAFMEVAVTVTALWLGAGWIKAGTMTVGSVVLFAQYIAQIYWPIIMLTDQLAEIQRAGGAADRIFSALDETAEIHTPDEPISLPPRIESIEFRNVSFSYAAGVPVLNNVSFRIDGGQTLAIVGPTGGGKSTIISLLCRFYDPDEGTIFVNGKDIRSFDLELYRRQFGLVLQDLYLFPASIRENLRLFRTEISESAITDALQTAGIHNFIMSRSDGLDHILAEKGKNLSQGERQLLAFARALTIDPRILILDEATSSVDPGTEHRIQETLNELLLGRTNFIVAHRLSTIRKADQIIVIDGGVIRERGSHLDLLAEKGYYYRLLMSQSFAGTDEEAKI